jgi:hypothetical protein
VLVLEQEVKSDKGKQWLQFVCIHCRLSRLLLLLLLPAGVYRGSGGDRMALTGEG